MHTQQERSISIMIVDEHAVLRAGLRAILDHRVNTHVVGEASSREKALTIAAEYQPDIILLDLALGEESGSRILPELLAAAPGARAIVLTGVHDPDAHISAVKAGAMGLVFKEQEIETLLEAITAVYAGEVWLDGLMIAGALKARPYSKIAPAPAPGLTHAATLTTREREVIRLVGAGMRNKQIADKLVISEATVRHHLTSIFAKLDVNDRFELVVYAYQHGLAEPPR